MDQNQTDLTLMDLIQQVNFGMTKSASEEDKKDEKQEKDESDESSKNEGKDDSKNDEKDEAEGEDGQTKTASELGASFAREILQKQASMNTTQSTEAGNVLAKSLLETLQKKASAGDMNAATGIPDGVAPNKNQVDNAQMDAEHAATVKPMPTSDGLRPTGTINEIFDAMVQDSLAQGAASVDQVHDQGVAKQEGEVVDHAVPNQVKVAQVNELMAQGIDFDTAIDMVKQASEQLQDDLEKAAAVQYLVEVEGLDFEKAAELIATVADEMEFEKVAMQKRAQLDYLMGEGFDFDEAVELVKQASAGDMNPDSGIPDGVAPNKNQIDNAQMDAEHEATVKPMPTSDGLRPTGTINEIFDAIVEDAMSQGAASVDQVHDQGVAKQEGEVVDHAVPNQVKVAKLNELLAEGVDFDTAMWAVKEAALKSPKAFREMMGQAGELAKATGRLAGRYVGTKGREAAGAAEALIRPGVQKGSGMTAKQIRMEAAKSLATNPLVLGGAAATAGGAAYALNKKAAFDALIEQGVDFDTAADMVKEAALKSPKAFRAMVGQAGELAKATGRLAGRYVGTKGREAVGAAEALVRPGIHAGAGMTAKKVRMEAAKSLATNPLVLGGAAAAAGGGAYAMHKKAAFDALIEQGVDFDTAAQLVIEKAAELYGE